MVGLFEKKRKEKKKKLDKQNDTASVSLYAATPHYISANGANSAGMRNGGGRVVHNW